MEAVELYRKLAKADPKRYLTDLADTLACAGTTYGHLDQPEQALTAISEAVQIYRSLNTTQPTLYKCRLAKMLAAYSGVLLDLGRIEDARTARQEADLHGVGC